MRAIAGLIATILLIVTTPASAQAPRTPEEMKKAVSITRFPDGRIVASSAAFAPLERTARYANNGRGSESASVVIEAWPGTDRPVEIYFVAVSDRALYPTETQAHDDAAEPDKIVDGYVGPPWKKTTARVLENTVTCEHEGQWCHHKRYRRIDLTQGMVRDIVHDEHRTSIGMSLRPAHSDWTIPRSHLIATLDAIGLLRAFQ